MLHSVECLAACGLPPAAAHRFGPHAGPVLQRFSITTPERVAAFLAQAHVESMGFSRLSENLFYTSPERLRGVWPSRFPTLEAARPFVRAPERLANHVYAGRLGNGPEASGDGWRFRGRGLKQLTGRRNYARAAQALGRPYLDDPDLVAQPADALLTAAWYWAEAGANGLADRGAIDAITRAVNGPAMLAAAERRRLSALYLERLRARPARAA